MLAWVNCLFSAGILLQGSAPPPKSWIADVKAERASLGAREIRIEGDVVDIRSTSPVSRSGFYRIIDATDPEGVLIRTDRLPHDGGALRVYARLAAQQPSSGPILLEELDQQRIDRRPVAPLVIGVMSLALLVILTLLLIRAAIAERKFHLSPPLWLLPDAGPYGKSLALPNPTTPSLQYSPELEEADRVQRERLKRKKRSLFRAMLGSFATAGASVAWFVTIKPVQAQVPAFIFIEANDTPIPAARQPEGAAADSVRAILDSMILAMQTAASVSSDRPEPRPSPRDSGKTRLPKSPETRGGDSTPRVAAPPVFTPAPSPAPSPAPAPAPVPPPREEPPPRDPEADRVMVSQVLTQAAGRLVDAINSRRLDNVARLLPEGISGDLPRRDRFMKLLKDYSPRASLAGVEGTTLAEDSGEVRFTVQFEWRGDFGVGSRKTGRFAGIASRSGTEWRFEGARLLSAVP